VFVVAGTCSPSCCVESVLVYLLISRSCKVTALQAIVCNLSHVFHKISFIPFLFPKFVQSSNKIVVFNLNHSRTLITSLFFIYLSETGFINVKLPRGVLMKCNPMEKYREWMYVSTILDLCTKWR
jgi:hypothetical protein